MPGLAGPNLPVSTVDSSHNVVKRLNILISALTAETSAVCYLLLGWTFGIMLTCSVLFPNNLLAGRLIDQSLCLALIVAERIVEIWEACASASLPPSAIYRRPWRHQYTTYEFLVRSSNSVWNPPLSFLFPEMGQLLITLGNRQSESSCSNRPGTYVTMTYSQNQVVISKILLWDENNPISKQSLDLTEVIFLLVLQTYCRVGCIWVQAFGELSIRLMSNMKGIIS